MLPYFHCNFEKVEFLIPSGQEGRRCYGTFSDLYLYSHCTVTLSWWLMLKNLTEFRPSRPSWATSDNLADPGSSRAGREAVLGLPSQVKSPRGRGVGPGGCPGVHSYYRLSVPAGEGTAQISESVMCALSGLTFWLSLLPDLTHTHTLRDTLFI